MIVMDFVATIDTNAITIMLAGRRLAAITRIRHGTWPGYQPVVFGDRWIPPISLSNHGFS
jgi:hypothetical protein